jgi:triacylglycerol lipase
MLNDPWAAQMGLLAMRAEDMYAALRSTHQQNKLDPPLDPAVAAAYDLQGYIAGSDCLVQLDPVTKKMQLRASGFTVFYGFVASSKANPHQSVVVIRGTGDLWEWFKDGQFVPVPHPQSGGQIEDGFNSIYQTMTYCSYAAGGFTGQKQRAATGIAQLIPDGKATVVGHSLGSALATYLALELAVDQKMGSRATACMFASPRPGDTTFVDYVDKHLTAYTLYNYSRDAVPTVPLLFGYSSLPRAIKITPDAGQADIKYDRLLPLSIENLKCQHHVVCYSAMLDYHAANWAALPPIDQVCAACIVGPKTG